MEHEIVITRLIKLETLMENFFLQQGKLEGRMVSEERTRAEQKKEIVNAFEGVRKEYIQMLLEVDRLKIENARQEKERERAEQKMSRITTGLIVAVGSTIITSIILYITSK